MTSELPPSPCVRQCCLDEASLTCVGCFRTLDEITGWHQAGADERRGILDRCVARREAWRLCFADPGLR